jgi:hypothetical protein
MRIVPIYFCLVAVFSFSTNAQQFPDLVTEQTQYQATSRYADVMRAVDFVAQHYPNANVEYFATTLEGKRLPLLIFSDRKIKSPEEAIRLDRPIVLVLGNIHAGEVEGKEATLLFMREIVNKVHEDDLKKLILLVIPIYNADGNDKIVRTNRISQNGPSQGVGVRATSEGYDLNRDLIKLESIEARGLVDSVFNRWDPILYMELHTTNGSFHGYHLTWANGLNPNTDPAVAAFQGDIMMPEITRKMLARSWRIFPYGDYRREAYPDSGWYTFGHQPRYGTNYYPLRNRLSLLSESYSYVDFEHRITLVKDFISETLTFCMSHSDELMRLRSSLAKQYSQFGRNVEAGVKFSFADPRVMRHLTGSVDTVVDKESGLKTYKMRRETTELDVPVYDRFRATLSRPIPFAYAIDNHTGRYNAALEKLKLHGIAFREIASEEPVAISSFRTTTVKKASRAYQKHVSVSVSGEFAAIRQPLKGWISVSTVNDKRNLIFYLLEPESDDGLVAWNYFDYALDKGTDEPFPIVKIMNPVTLKTVDPTLPQPPTKDREE